MAAKKRMKKGSIAEEKAKKQKIMLAVLGVVFIGLLAFQGPKTLKMLTAKPPADEAHATDYPAATTTTPATTPAAAPATAAPTSTGAPATAPVTAPVTPAATVVAGGIGIADTSSEPAPAAGQLISFDRFRTKDPFVPQVNAGCTPDPSEGTTCPTVETATPATPNATPETGASPSTGTATAAKPSAPSEPSSPGTVTPPTPPATGGTTVPPATEVADPTSATIAVNGVSQSVAVHGTFPEADPTFRLAAVTKKGAKIGLVGGSYSAGGPTITLKVGKTVTLMNTADGTRYKIKLVSVA